MFKPSRRYKQKTMSVRRVFFLTLILFIIFTSAGIWIVNEKMKPALLAIATTQAEQLGNYAINYGIGQKVLTNLSAKDDPNDKPDLDVDKLIVTQKNDQNEVSDYTLNSTEANRMKGVVTDRILWFIRSAEKGNISMTNGSGDDPEYRAGGEGLVADIPLGQVLNNALLSNFGPRVPVEMDIVSNVLTDIRWSYKNVGINNVVIMYYLNVKVKVDVIVPFAVKTKTILQHIPIGSKLVPRDVPYYYGSGGLTPALPTEKGKTSDK
ncbi:MAG: sporulation protein YunB [Sporolactobacillus sp.]|jgi:sporulation protein YunB|nr:sporulation protein YunB [Sporolactobacillus sp.]